ncbi:peptide chain release factor N(5)-glutamine methyltransferase [Actimicrobium sp. CCI2.3]|uniref:peptide chain release factor N(5)-glutamine methyltransferase n=1 Tax=Actimicrobium sp. CCI2.3 TaxID=3048616 RepID=UPI002AB51388|nr:peptide chain release factor N(5)-glutamine methyltransferase [Actimicrobium sp. CCI2.3]MDY7573395.1 peptide chain release factor N(5)-glutamine methyltransferase [Actimicrobium sp. CCI2.3]MEB0021793.1 peptide chain release factor N(5)-glutamine methyltransferase [Actimicrobium sp. CCI2.3]
MPLILAGDTIDTVLKQPAPGLAERRILLGHVLGLTRVALITRSEQALTPAQAAGVAELFARRIAGEPIAYLIGSREFYGLRFEVTPAVLIPRPETELLVELAIDRLPRQGRVLDMGTGSGAIAVAIANSRRDAAVSAVDLSDAALAVARRNATCHAVQVHLLRSDWYAALSEQRFDMIVANPPYIVAGDHHLSEGDLRFEPVDALTDHSDGLSALRHIIRGAAAFLEPAGWLLLEHGYDQAAAVCALLDTAQFTEVQSWADLAGIARVSGGRRCSVTS